MPAEIQRYFPQRNSLFSRYTSHDILLDHVGWYSVTPEKIAQHQAERCQCDTVLDAFAGVGGNAIAFAFTCERVIAMDKSMERLKIARHNARAYGVEDRIEWICSDYVEFVEAWVKRKKAEHVDGELGNEIDVVFLSPPWGEPLVLRLSSCQGCSLNSLLIGGTDYLTAESAAGPEASAPVIKNDHQLPNHLPPFDLSHLLPLPGSQLYKLTRNLSPNMAMFLPRNSDPNEIASWADLHHGEIGSDGEPLKEWVEVEEEWMGHSTMDPFQEPTSNRQKKKKQARMSAGGQRPNEGKLKALTAYFGGLVGGNEAI